jgi:glutaredoxin-dependent peroxiredoxin
MTLNIGDKAPTFALKTLKSGKLIDVHIADEIGKRQIVLLFFPLAFTSVCTKEMCDVSGALSDYVSLDAVAYGISVDSPFAQEAFAKANRISVTLLSDFNREVSALYGVLFKEFLGLKGVSKRAAFVIGMDGKIRYAESSDDPAKLPDFVRVKDALRN